MTHTSTQQPEALNLEEFRTKVTHAAREPLLARIEELETKLAAAQQGVPQGWKLVPVEPTEKMISEGSCAQTLKHGHQYISECTAKTAWPSMLAPTKPIQQGLDARDTAFEAVRKAFCNLQRYSFLLDSRGNVRRCADHSGDWVEFEAVHTLLEPQSVDAALAAQAKCKGG